MALFDKTAYERAVHRVYSSLIANPAIMGHPKMAGRDGCAYCVIEPGGGEPLDWYTVGVIAPEDSNRYLGFSREKPTRLEGHPGLPLSYFCRNEAQQKWGGGVCGETFLGGISGYPGDLDEVSQLAVFIHYGELSYTQAERILEMREAISSLTLPSGLIVPVAPNEFAKYLPYLAQ